VLEDNKYSQSTCQEETLAGDILSRPQAFGIESVKSNTWEFEHLIDVSNDLIKKIRNDSKPRFLQIETFRLKAHSKGDDNRPADLINAFNLKDPLNIFLGGMSQEEEGWVKSIRNQVENAVSNAEKSSIYDISQAIKKDTLGSENIKWIDFQPHTGIRFVDSLNEAFVTLMGETQGLYMLGEDIESPYGGAFKATKELSRLFPGRVRNTPISEACIVGIGGGMGLLGFTAVVEIMFGDFIGLAFDQIVNHVAKFKDMYGNNGHTNIIIRTPMGGGRGYGPTHSQTLDKHFLGIPGIKVIALNNYIDPIEVFRPLIQEQLGPAIVIENKIMYGSFCNQNIPEGFTFKRSNDKFPNILVSPDSNAIDITLIGYGGMSDLLMQACDVLFEEHDIVAQVLLITQLYPLDIAASVKSIREAKAIVVIEEGQGFSGFGSEIISQIFENNLTQCKVRRIFADPTCIPSSSILEKEVLPSIKKIIECALLLINHD
jgi:2-oxoisovalerate dehydrogenase E1 component